MFVTVPNDSSQQVLDASNDLIGIVFQNTSGQDIWLHTDQQSLDSNVDQATGLPHDGYQLVHGGDPLIIPFFSGKWYCRAQNAGGVLTVFSYPVYCPCK